MKTLLLIVCSILALSSMQSAEATDQWVYGLKIRKIYAFAETPTVDGSFILAFSPNASQCSGTGSPKSHYVRIGNNSMTLEAAKNIYALALLAVSMDKQVDINFDRDSTQCYIKSMIMNFNP